jgi:hypothetical protein
MMADSKLRRPDYYFVSLSVPACMGFLNKLRARNLWCQKSFLYQSLNPKSMAWGLRNASQLDAIGVAMAEQPNPYKCQKCGRSFSSEDQLLEHMKNCTGPDPHPG